MILKLIICISLLFINTSNGMRDFKSEHLCNKPLKCVGSYDAKYFYSVKCTQQSCDRSTTHMHECSPDHCALNEMSCDLFQNLNKYLKTLYSSRSDQYKQFISNVKTCATNQHTLGSLNSVDVCVNGDECILKEQHIKITGIRTLILYLIF